MSLSKSLVFGITFFLGIASAQAETPRVWEAKECTFAAPDETQPVPPSIFLPIAPVPQAPPDLCEGRGTSVVASVKYHVLALCEDGKMVADYEFVFGSGGVDKVKEGDKKTPLGTYSLARARESEKFGIFIHVGYPTAAQVAEAKKNGVDPGGAVGIHGPIRRLRCMGTVNLLMNWTAGCLALASDRLVAEVANWLEQKPQGRKIHIIQ